MWLGRCSSTFFFQGEDETKNTLNRLSYLKTRINQITARSRFWKKESRFLRQVYQSFLGKVRMDRETLERNVKTR